MGKTLKTKGHQDWKKQIYTPYMMKDWIIKYDHDNISKIK